MPKSVSDTESTSNDSKCNASNQTISFKDLKEMTKQMLKCRGTHEQIKALIHNFIKHYRFHKNVLCKIIFMIELNTSDWTDHDLSTFLRWYYQKLQRLEKHLANVRMIRQNENINVTIH